MKKKEVGLRVKPLFPHFNLLVDRLEINENRTVYLHYKVMIYKQGVPRQVGKACVNLFQNLREIGFGGEITLSLLGDRGIQWEKPRRM